MMKKYNIKQLLIYCFMLFITCILKNQYLPEIINDSSSFIPFRILIFYSKNTYINFVWLIPIISSVFILSSSLYYRLINFDVRLKNRQRYLFKLLKESLKQNIFMSIMTIVIQWILFMFAFNFTIEINVDIFQVVIKYIIEIYLLSIIIVFLALLINNYIYSYIITVSTMIILLNSFVVTFIPFINIYCDYTIRFVDVLSIVLLVVSINHIYRNKDLGGVKNEVDC